MKLSLIIGTAVLLVSGVAIAYDMTHLAQVKPHETKQMSVDLPSGKSTVEVWSEDKGSISCTFIQHGTGNVVYEAANVHRCIGNANLTLPTTMIARITNNSNNDMYLRVWVHDQK